MKPTKFQEGFLFGLITGPLLSAVLTGFVVALILQPK